MTDVLFASDTGAGEDAIVLLHGFGSWHGNWAAAAGELGGRVTLVAGGATRSDSVRAGLEVLEGSGITHVLIHDGARPLVSPATIGAVVVHGRLLHWLYPHNALLCSTYYQFVGI